MSKSKEHLAVLFTDRSYFATAGCSSETIPASVTIYSQKSEKMSSF
jgi:hypothetical protein